MWRVLSSENADHARRRFRSGNVDVRDAPVCNRALNEHAVRELRTRNFGGIFRRASDLNSAIEARDGLTDKCRAHSQLISATMFKARTIARFASSILNELYL